MVHPTNSRAARIVVIASIMALGACETLPTARRAGAAALSAVDANSGAGTYYPAVTSRDAPDVRFVRMAGVGPQQRQFFVDQINLAAVTPGRTMAIVAQATGEDSDTLVLLYLGGEGAMTPYLARGLLARMTSITRAAPAIAEMGLSSEFDIYNMAAVLGFRRIIVTDGRDFSHEADLSAD
jgi:hypothetical protein